MEWKKMDKDQLLFDWLLFKEKQYWETLPQKTIDIAIEEVWPWMMRILHAFYIFGTAEIDKHLTFWLLDGNILRVAIKHKEKWYEIYDAKALRLHLKKESFLKKWYFLLGSDYDPYDTYLEMDERLNEFWVVDYLLKWRNDQLELNNEALNHGWNYYQWKIHLKKTIEILNEYSEKYNNKFIQVKLETNDTSLDILTSIIYLDVFCYVEINDFSNFREKNTLICSLTEKFYSMKEDESNFKKDGKYKKIFSWSCLKDPNNERPTITLWGYESKLCEYFFDINTEKDSAKYKELIEYIYWEFKDSYYPNLTSLYKTVNKKAKNIGISEKLFSSVWWDIIRNNLFSS